MSNLISFRRSKTRKGGPAGIYERKTLELTRTAAKVQANLDPESVLALRWSAAWLTRQGIPEPPASAVIRRAVQAYAAHLHALGRPLDADPTDELRAVRRAAQPSLTPADALPAALESLEAASPEEPLPSPAHFLRPDAIATVIRVETKAADALRSILSPRALRHGVWGDEPAEAAP